jgi:CSLREA domain-containing protein
MSAPRNSSRDRNSVRNRKPRKPYRLQLESLEDRYLLATFLVNSTADLTDANPGDGICDTSASGGVCTLRAAIQEANAFDDGGPDTINVPAGTYTLTLTGTGEDAAATGDLDILDDLTIRQNPGDMGLVIIQAGTLGPNDDSAGGGNGIDRVFDVPDLGNNMRVTNVTISDVTIQHGKATTNGGGINYNTLGLLDLTRVAVTDNSSGLFGGGIFNRRGNMDITDSSITNNRSASDGGGIDAAIDGSGVVTITDSSIIGNTSGGDGGGVFNDFGGTLTITGTTISNNSAESGGGIFNSGTANVQALTSVTSNQANDNGGGIFNFGQLFVTDSTISINIAVNGGGIANDDGHVEVTSSLINVNTAVLSGGGIATAAESGAGGGTLIIDNSTISGNEALALNGGGIYNGNDSVFIDDSTLNGNTAGVDGGGIYTSGVPLTNATLDIQDSALFDNVAGAEGFGNGGAIFNDGDVVTISNSTISRNTAESQGGGIFNSPDGELTTANVTITDNTSGRPSFAFVANMNDQGFVSAINIADEIETASIFTINFADPYWVNISADGSVVAVSLHNDTGVALIDGPTATLLGVVGGVGNEPEAVAVNSNGTTVYVADENPPGVSDGDLYVVDVATRTVTGGPIDLSAFCNEPENMVISPDDSTLYITCAGSSVIQVDTTTFAITQIDSGLSDPHGIVLNAAGTRLYYTDGSDTFEFNTVTDQLTGTVFSGCSLYGGALSRDETQLYCVEEGSELTVYSTATGSLVATITFSSGSARAVGVSPDGSKILVPISFTSVVEVVDAATLTDLPGNIAVTGGSFPRPRGIAVRSAEFGGGGIFNRAGSVELQNTIVAGNRSDEPSGVSDDDFGGSGVDPVSSFNLIGVAGESGLVNGMNGNQVGSSVSPLDPRLGALQNNGGPTNTHALCEAGGVPDTSCQGTSPAIDAGDNNLSPGPFDQRGPGFARIAPSGGTIDIGAFEVQGAEGCSLEVDTINDSQDGGDAENSLREAINCANSDPDFSAITFNIPGDGPHTIQVGLTGFGALPEIFFPVSIDGYTQGDSTGTATDDATPNSLAQGNNAVLKIELDGTNAGGGANGLFITAGASIVRGLVINRFGSDGIRLDNNIEIGGGDGNLIEGNFIGTEVDGGSDAGNDDDGIDVRTANNTIGGPTAAARNLISGNGDYGGDSDGIHLFGPRSSGTLIQNNYVGTDADGTEFLGNQDDGIDADSSSNNTIRGNLVSGNLDDGIELDGGGDFEYGGGCEFDGDYGGAPDCDYGGFALGTNAAGNLIVGNFVGTDVTGTQSIGNDSDGIVIQGADNNTIGGTTAADRNIISGNFDDGIDIEYGGNDYGGSGRANLIIGNRIGTDVTGTLPLGNLGDGVNIDDTADNTIGGTAAGAGNLISANFDGVFIEYGGATGNLVQGNLIGTDVTGTQDLGNEDDGVDLDNGANNNTIGGTTPGARNVISNNGENGVTIEDADQNLVQGNRIGTNAAGTAALPNKGNAGVNIIADSVFNTIGGSALGAGNLISGNAGHGVLIEYGGDANLIEGNLIGTQANGTSALGNNNSNVHVERSFDNRIIGNTIAFSTEEDTGISVQDSSGIEMRRNSIFQNVGLGIDLNDDGVSLNDLGDIDGEANGTLNFPILETATISGGNLTITGFARPNVEIELFIADPDPTGFGEGKSFLVTLIEGSVVSPVDNDASVDTYGPGPINGLSQGTDTTNRFSFTIPTPAGVGVGTILTATATEPQLARGTLGTPNTSEFSGNITVEGAAQFDFGDAPSSYGNPSHQTANGPLFGDHRDPEASAQPNGTATGDDLADEDDEDGVTFTSSLRAGFVASVDVEVNFVPFGGEGSASLDAFVDFNADGDFNDPGEEIFDGQTVFQGTNELFFFVPFDATTGFTFSRFRVSSEQNLSPDGPAGDGEVEDYRVRIIGGEGGCEDFALDLPETHTEGNLKARVSGGLLRVRGDFFGNGLVIEAGDGPDSFRLTPLGGTTLNRQFGSVEFVGASRGIQVGLLGGPDVLVIDGTTSELVISGKLRIRSGTSSVAIIDRALSLFDDHDTIAIVDALLESGLTVKLRRGADDLALCGVEALHRVRTGEGLGPDTLTVDDSIFDSRYNSGVGVGQDVISIEQHGNPDGPTTEFNGRKTKLRGRKGNDAICIGIAGEPGNSASFHGKTKIRGGRGRHDSLDGLDTGTNTFDTPPIIVGIEQVDSGNPACGLE